MLFFFLVFCLFVERSIFKTCKHILLRAKTMNENDEIDLKKKKKNWKRKKNKNIFVSKTYECEKIMLSTFRNQM